MEPSRTLVERLETEQPETAAHGRAVGGWAARIAAYLRMSRDEIAFVQRCGELHDIGKLFVPRDLLRLPRPLVEDERCRLRAHVTLGDEAISLHPDLFVYRDAVRWHHERYDGRGYPDGLRGEQIPLAARIVAVADVYDALTGVRPYRFPASPERALCALERGRGGQFDPEITDAMIAVVSAARRPIAV